MGAPDLPPYIADTDGPDEEAERVIASLSVLFGHQRWRPTTDREAAFVMAKLAAATREINAAEAQADEWRERIGSWLYDTTRRATATRSWAEALLCRYLEDRNAADPKVKSIPLPDGKITSTAGRIEWVVADPDAVLEAAATDPDLSELVVPASVAGPQTLAKLLTARESEGDAVTADGTIVPGITVRRRARTYKATPIVG